MKLNKLASVIMRSTWLLDPRIVVGYGPNIARFLNNEKVSWFEDDDDEDDHLGVSYITAEGRMINIKRNPEAGNIFEGAPDGSIAIIPIHGVIMKSDGFCGEPGTDTISNWIRDFRDADNVPAAILHINSGGGQVDGTGDLAQLIMEVDQYKPIIGWTDALMASAAYWIGSACRELYASYATVEVGSIGTCISFMTNQKYLESLGYKKHYVNASDSIHKNQDFIDAQAGNYEGIITNLLDPTNDVFTSHVKDRRTGLVLTEVEVDGKKYYEPLTGKVYLAKKAVEIKLIDGILSRDQVISRASELSKGSNSRSNFSKSHNMSLFNKNPKLTSLAKKAVAGETVTTAELEEVNEELNKEGKTGLVILQQSTIEQLEKDAEAGRTATKNLETITADRDKYKQLSEKYGDQPGALGSNPVKKEGVIEEQSGDKKEKVQSWNDPEAPWNKSADSGRTSRV